MAFTTHVLVVANQTVDAPALLAALRHAPPADRSTRRCWPRRPARSARGAATSRQRRGAGGGRHPGSGELGDADPIVAVQEAWNPGRYDEVVVATLAEGSSRWLQIELPQRVAKLTDCPVHHVSVPERRPAPPTRGPPERRPMLERVASLMRSGTKSGAA